MTDDVMRKRQPPACFGQKCKPIVVGDKVKMRYAKTSEYLLAKVLAIEGDDMTVQWLGDVGPSEPAKVPLGYVCAIGADSGYDDGCSALGGSSSSKQPARKGSGQCRKPRRSLGLCTT
jgi:hypothetical protein